MATLTAVTTARVNLRAGAGTQHSILATLPVKTALEKGDELVWDVSW